MNRRLVRVIFGCVCITLSSFAIGCTSGRALAQHRDHAAALVAEACSDITSENFDEAISKLQQALAEKPGYRLALQNLATAYTNKAWKVYGAEQWKEAAQSLRKAIDITRLVYGSTADVSKMQTCLNFCEQAVRANAQQSAESGLGSSQDYLSELRALHWDKNKMPLRVYVAPGDRVPSYRSEFAEQIRKAEDAWSEASGNLVRFAETNDRNNCDIEIAWSNDRSKAVSPSEAGHTVVAETENNTITHAKIILFTIPAPGLPRPIQPSTMYAAALHELGHAIAFDGHSKHTSDIMAPAVKYIQSPRGAMISLSPRDCNSITKIYSQASNQASDKTREPEYSPELEKRDRQKKASILNNEAAIAIKQGDFSTASAKLTRALALVPQYAIASENLAVTHLNWAIQLCNAGKFADAEPHLKQAKQIREALGQTSASVYGPTLQCYIVCLEQLKRFEEAKQMRAQKDSLHN